MSAFFWKTVLDWVPFVLFVALMAWFMRRFANLQRDAMKRLTEHRELQVDEMRRINVNLERIVAALDAQRPSAQSAESGPDTRAKR